MRKRVHIAPADNGVQKLLLAESEQIFRPSRPPPFHDDAERSDGWDVAIELSVDKPRDPVLGGVERRIENRCPSSVHPQLERENPI